jgi:tetratricopeptide (TPR) repeat protein
VSGNPKTSLFSFNKELLALANTPETQSQTSQLLAARGNYDELDPEIANWYNQYRTYLQKGRLIWGEKQSDTINCAKYYYLKLINDGRAKTLLPSLKSSFIANLKHKTDVKLNSYISGGTFKDPNGEAYEEMVYAKSLVDSSYILYNYLTAMIYFLKANRIKFKDSEAAITLSRKIISIEPDAFYGYNDLANSFEFLYFRENNIEKRDPKLADSVVYYYKKAISISPTRYQTFLHLGIFYDMKGNLDQAIIYTDNGLKVASKHPELNFITFFNQLYNFFKQKKQSEKADSVLNKGIEYAENRLNKDTANKLPFNFYNNLGYMYNRKGDFAKAINCYNKWLAIDTNRFYKYVTYNDLAESFKTGLKNYIEAIRYYNLAIKIDPDGKEDFVQFNIFKSLSETYILLNDTVKALEVLNQAIKIFPFNPQGLIEKGKIYLKMKNKSKASESFNQAIKLNPKDAKSYSSISDAYYDLKDYENYIKVILKAIAQKVDEPGNYYNLACGYSIKNQTPKSLANLEISIQKGFNDYNHINEDTDLTNIRKLPEFKELMKKYFSDKVKY